jgi:hypothetical protein
LEEEEEEDFMRKGAMGIQKRIVVLQNVVIRHLVQEKFEIHCLK